MRVSFKKQGLSAMDAHVLRLTTPDCGIAKPMLEAFEVP